MQKIMDYLEDNNIKEQDLTQDIQDAIDAYDERVEAHNDLVDELETAADQGQETAELKEKVRGSIIELDTQEGHILTLIKDWHKTQITNQQQQQQQQTSGTPAPKPDGSKQEESKEEGGMSSLILGAFFLVVTLGAVKYFKNR